MTSAAHTLAVKMAYSARRRMPSPNILMRIPLLKPVPAITPISFNNMAKPDPAKTVTPGLNLARVPLLEETQKNWQTTQDINAKNQQTQDRKFSDAAQLAMDSAAAKTQRHKEIIQKERESLAKEREALNEAKEQAQKTEEATASPHVESFITGLDALRKRIVKEAAETKAPSFMDGINKPGDYSWLGGMQHASMPDNPNMLQSLLYGPLGRGVFNSVIGSGIDEDFTRNFQRTGAYSAAPIFRTQPSQMNLLNMLMQAETGQRAF